MAEPDPPGVPGPGATPPGSRDLAQKEESIRQEHRLDADVPIVFLEVSLGDASEFYQEPLMEVTQDQGRIILRDHFCPNIGWSGFEAMIVVGENPPVRMWTTGVVRDGVALPEPPPEE